MTTLAQRHQGGRFQYESKVAEPTIPEEESRNWAPEVSVTKARLCTMCQKQKGLAKDTKNLIDSYVIEIKIVSSFRDRAGIASLHDVLETKWVSYKWRKSSRCLSH